MPQSVSQQPNEVTVPKRVPPRPPAIPVRPPKLKKKPAKSPHHGPRRGVRGVKGRPRGKVRKELSAGGVAVRQEGQQWLVALLQTEHKRGKVWVLPKGHVELHTNERVSDAAKREVQEEAGLKDLSVKDQLGITRFSFQVEDGVVHKTVHYFLMITNQKQLIPQAEEGLIDAAWFPIDEAIRQLAYDTDQDIVAKAREKLTGQPVPVARKSVRRTRTPRIHS